MKSIVYIIKKENIFIEPLIHGGKSTTIYRSGTPAVGLIVSLAKALRLVNDDFLNKYERVSFLNGYLISKLEKLNVSINSNKYCVPHIVNISLKGIKPETMLHALEQDDIYISTQTACSFGDYSEAVMAISGDMEKAAHSMRISISYLTLEEEIDEFIDSFSKNIDKLSF